MERKKRFTACLWPKLPDTGNGVTDAQGVQSTIKQLWIQTQAKLPLAVMVAAGQTQHRAPGIPLCGREDFSQICYQK